MDSVGYLLRETGGIFGKNAKREKKMMDQELVYFFCGDLESLRRIELMVRV